MAQNNARVPENLYCPIMMQMYPSHQFRALQCGHCFSVDFLRVWSEGQFGDCPNCRQRDGRLFEELPGIEAFAAAGGRPIYEEIDLVDARRPQNIEEMARAQSIRRSQTIRVFFEAAKQIKINLVAGNAAVAGGGGLGVIAGGLGIAGAICVLIPPAIFVGIPLLIASAAVGGGGAVVGVGGAVGKLIRKNVILGRANAQFQTDYFYAMQMQVFLMMAAEDEDFAQRYMIDRQVAVAMTRLFTGAAHIGTATASAVRAAIGGAAKVGLHVAGLVMSAALLPFDIYQIVTASLNIHRRNTNETVVAFEDLATAYLENLVAVLRQKNYALEVHDVDSRRLVVAVADGEHMEGLRYDYILANRVVLVDFAMDEENI